VNVPHEKIQGEGRGRILYKNIPPHTPHPLLPPSLPHIKTKNEQYYKMRIYLNVTSWAN